MIGFNFKPFWMYAGRFAALGSVAALALLGLTFSACWIATTTTAYENSFFDAHALYTLLVSIVTVGTVLPTMIIAIKKRGARVNYIIFELAWLAVIGALWAGSGALSALAYFTGWLDCTNVDHTSDKRVHKGCKQTNMLQSVSYFIGILLLAYISILLTVALMSQKNGSKIWYSTVADAKYAIGHFAQGTHGINGSTAGFAQMSQMPQAPLPPLPVPRQAYSPQGQQVPPPAQQLPQPGQQPSPYSEPATQEPIAPRSPPGIPPPAQQV